MWLCCCDLCEIKTRTGGYVFMIIVRTKHVSDYAFVICARSKHVLVIMFFVIIAETKHVYVAMFM